jgi:outer membrane immunogenic protein
MTKAVTMRPVAPSVDRSATAGRAPPWCSAWRHRATGLISAATIPAFLFATDRNQSRIDAFGLFTGQIGYAWNNALLYVKGGAAVTADKYNLFDIPTGALLDIASETRWGSVFGVGFEYGFAPNWSLGFEYDHLFMGSRDVGFFDATGAFDFIEHVRQDVDVLTVRFNYKFGGPGPVVARY